VDVEEVRWDKGSTVGAGDYIYIKKLNQHKPWFDEERL
jgi:hypothetical protein